jgi:alkylation response protein AidB-like acyl-CoA dehydrogenase
MDFRFDDAQIALRDAIRALCTQHFALDAVAHREGTPATDHTWRALAEMGVFALLVPGEPGGAVEAAIVFEQLGAHVASGPYRWTTCAAPLVPDAPTGAARVTGVVFDAAATAHVVLHADETDVLVVLDGDRVALAAVGELADPARGTPLDPLTPAASYSVLPQFDAVGNAADAGRIRLTGTILTAAELVGAAQGSLDVAAAYALERQQFGVPIGSFQAVKHILADMFVRVELARSATYAAAALFDDDGANGGVAAAASAAKLLAGEAGIANGRAAVQVLGGMGFTWEMLPHYFLKRAWLLEELFGTGDRHALALAAEVGSWI